MDQEQIFDRGARVTLDTGKQLFQFLAYAAQQLYKAYDEQKLVGQQSWKNFNQSSLTKDHIDFLEADVNLKKFTDELKKSGVRFAFKDLGDGTKQVWFEAPNREVIADALRNTLNEIINDPKKAKEKYMKSEKELTPKEQINKIKKNTKEKLDTVKTKKKGKSI
ncbi:conjugative transposon protein [Streptococcus infantarius subsp. infantarius]|nr:conjugative transposon protein [Streptococcus infantarius subsp. infantarius]